MDPRPIGCFDSGVGGLTIWREVKARLPHESLIFLADQLHVPYGEKSEAELKDLCARIVRLLLRDGSKLIVIACNTATVYAIAHLRETFPKVPFVGVVPVVKVLAEQTQVGRVGLLSTPATARSPYLAGLIERFAQGVQVVSRGCEGLEDLVETGQVDSPQVTDILRENLRPIQEAGVDAIGLDCTHYPFLTDEVRSIVGDGVRIFDPGEPVARRVEYLLQEHDLAAPPDAVPTYRFYTTGDPERFRAVASRLLGYPIDHAERAEI